MYRETLARGAVHVRVFAPESVVRFAVHVGQGVLNIFRRKSSRARFLRRRLCLILIMSLTLHRRTLEARARLNRVLTFLAVNGFFIVRIRSTQQSDCGHNTKLSSPTLCFILTTSGDLDAHRYVPSLCRSSRQKVI
jgi:hypothetical protein